MKAWKSIRGYHAPNRNTTPSRQGLRRSRRLGGARPGELTASSRASNAHGRLRDRALRGDLGGHGGGRDADAGRRLLHPGGGPATTEVTAEVATCGASNPGTGKRRRAT